MKNPLLLFIELGNNDWNIFTKVDVAPVIVIVLVSVEFVLPSIS